jgi:hypothetical protein
MPQPPQGGRREPGPNFKNLDKDAYRTRPNTPIGDLRGGGQQGKITTYYGSPMVRPAPGGPGDLRPRANPNRPGGPFNPMGKPKPRTGMRFAKVGNTPKG